MSRAWINSGRTTRFEMALQQARDAAPLMGALIFCVGCLIVVAAHRAGAAERERWDSITGLMRDQLAKLAPLRAAQERLRRAGVLPASEQARTIDELLALNATTTSQAQRDAYLVAAEIDAMEHALRAEAERYHLSLDP